MASNEDDFSSMLTGGLITIYVGSERKEYQVHKGHLASYEYWRKHLDSELTEDSQTMHLPQEHPKVWDLFVNWLYRGSLKDICVENEDIARNQVIQYVILYTQAEYRAIPALQNKIMDKLRAWTPGIWNWSTRYMIHCIYKNTPRHTPLRSYVVDSFLSKSSLWDADCENGRRAAQLKSHLDYGNKEFVIECYEALMQLTPKSKFRAPDSKIECTYHKHEDGKDAANETNTGVHLGENKRCSRFLSLFERKPRLASGFW